MLTAEEHRLFTQRYQGPLDALKRTELQKAVLDRTKRCVACPHCGAPNGPVKRITPFRLIHELYKQKKPTAAARKAGTVTRGGMGPGVRAQFEEAGKAIKELDAILDADRVQEDLTPRVVHGLFSQIRDSDCSVLDLALGSRPEWLILTKLLVPPVCIRPSIKSDDAANSRTEDDLTMTLREIVHINVSISRNRFCMMTFTRNVISFEKATIDQQSHLTRHDILETVVWSVHNYLIL